MDAERDERILIVAPSGRDGALLATALGRAGYRVETCESVGALAEAIALGAGAAIITEEALAKSDLHLLIRAVDDQPPWSDFPILLLVSIERFGDSASDPHALVEHLGNVTIIERPVRVAALWSSVRNAIRMRRRQYQARAQFTERMELLASERAARADAEHANRTKDDFLAMLSHELRTPLTAILGWARMLASNALEPSRTAAGLASIERNASLQARLIDDLLDISRAASGKITLDPQFLDLAAVTLAAVDAARPLATAREVSIEAEIVTTPVGGDRSRLQQVIDNLLSNAIKFTPPGGRVEVSLCPVGDRARLRVRDTGAGIAPDFLPRVFDRFRQAEGAPTTRMHGGLGLGLTIVRHLVTMHEGTVGAESPGPGLGATFTVELPLFRGDANAVGSRARTLSARLDGVRILLVEDEADTRTFLTMMLESRGAIVMAADSAPAAMRLIETARPDILVSDIGLPTENGYSLLRRIRRHADRRVANVPAIALTAFARDEDVTRSRDAGFQVHVTKPADPLRLVATLAELVAPRE